MKKREIMAKAWAIAREAVKQYGGKAVQYLSGALKMAWAAERHVAVIDRIAELETKGFKRWTKGSMDRLYISPEQLGLVCTFYRTGNISGAWFKGEEISNSQGRRLWGSKTFIDVKTEAVVSEHDVLRRAAAELAGL